MTDRSPGALADRLGRAARPVAFCGAGLSAESGVPTFRSAVDHALWSRHDPMELASVEGFRRHPERVRAWYAWRRGVVAAAQPNRAHHVLARWKRALLLTQNVDDLQERAGASEDRVVHLHGSIVHDRCHAECGWTARSDPARPHGPEHCPQCRSLARPAVVWFGEPLPDEAWTRASRACAECDLLLVVGTSGVVQPAATLVELAASNGAFVLNVNPEETALDGIADTTLHAPAAEILPDLIPD